MQEITVQECNEALKSGGYLIDVRTPAEYNAVHAAPALNIPLEHVDTDKLKAACSKGPWYIICQSGGRSSKACKTLSELSGVYNVVGGTSAWQSAGLEISTNGKKIMSIENQVRIIAGFLILVTVSLGQLINPLWLIFTGFIGAGLLFSGMFNFCGLAILLSKMPWNKGECCK